MLVRAVWYTVGLPSMLQRRTAGPDCVSAGTSTYISNVSLPFAWIGAARPQLSR